VEKSRQPFSQLDRLIRKRVALSLPVTSCPLVPNIEIFLITR